jgi:hypothetical protein
MPTQAPGLKCPSDGGSIVTRSVFILALGLFATPSTVCAEDSVSELTSMQKKAAAFRPNARDFVWREIPWHTDPTAALKQARDEKRPLFVWLAGGRDRDGTPLERC